MTLAQLKEQVDSALSAGVHPLTEVRVEDCLAGPLRAGSATVVRTGGTFFTIAPYLTPLPQPIGAPFDEPLDRAA